MRRQGDKPFRARERERVCKGRLLSKNNTPQTELNATTRTSLQPLRPANIASHINRHRRLKNTLKAAFPFPRFLLGNGDSLHGHRVVGPSEGLTSSCITRSPRKLTWQPLKGLDNIKLTIDASSDGSVH